MQKSGSCLCGAVTYQIEDAPAECGACHCGMCRRWSGGVYLGLHVPAGKATFTGEDRLTIYRSSDWAERGFCSTCGSNLFYRITAPGPQHGDLHFGFGTLDELFEALTLIQTYKIGRFPIILVGKTFWQGLLDWIKSTLLEEAHNINEKDLNLFRVVDTAEEAVHHIEEFYNKYMLKPNF